MGILNNGFGLIPDATAERSEYSKNEFSEGLIITEVINGSPDFANSLALAGTFMPKDSFVQGGSQTINKEYYAGSKHPSVQILGSRQDDVSFKGTFDEKFLNKQFDGAAEQYKLRLEQIEETGNIVLVTLGDYWKRYCVLASTKFTTYHKRKIDYDFTLSVIGTSLPKNYYFVDGKDIDVKTPNNELIAATASHLKLLDSKPSTVPRTVSDLIDSAVSEVASAVGSITGFVDGILSDSEKIQDSVYKAVGLIANTRSFIAKSQRRLGTISNRAESLAPTFYSEKEKTLAALNSSAYVHSVASSNKEVTKKLVTLQDKLNKFIKTIPFKRHLVIDGESLQKISIKYFGHADNWKAIQDHNKLQTTDLKVGSIVEIPRV